MYGDVLGAGVAVTVLISMLHHTGPVLRLWESMENVGRRVVLRLAVSLGDLRELSLFAPA